jgi:peptidoglycan hydrolase FlgJ
MVNQATDMSRAMASAGPTAGATGIASQPREAAAGAPGGDKARHAAEQFEAMFASQILREMRNAIREISPEGSMFRDQIGSGLMDMMDGQIALALASQRAFGIADFILKQIQPETLPGTQPAAGPARDADAARAAPMI